MRALGPAHRADHQLQGTSGQYAVEPWAASRKPSASRRLPLAQSDGEPGRAAPDHAGRPGHPRRRARSGSVVPLKPSRSCGVSWPSSTRRRRRARTSARATSCRPWLRVHLGMALAALGRRAEAETLLLRGHPAVAVSQTADTTRALRFLVGFYDDWNRAQPDAARAARAAEWRQRLASTGRVAPP